MLTERLNALESKTENLQNSAIVSENTEVKKPTPSSKSWSDRVTFTADFRDRYEYIDQQRRDIRQRDRVRLRAQFGMQVSNNLGFTMGLATGADDPVSTNQSLDGSFTTKDVRLDLA